MGPRSVLCGAGDRTPSFLYSRQALDQLNTSQPQDCFMSSYERPPGSHKIVSVHVNPSPTPRTADCVKSGVGLALYAYIPILPPKRKSTELEFYLKRFLDTFYACVHHVCAVSMEDRRGRQIIKL